MAQFSNKHFWKACKIMSVSTRYSAFQIDELYGHNQNLVGTFYNKNAFHVPFALRPALWSNDMKTAVNK
jgi:hypothetical protein